MAAGNQVISQAGQEAERKLLLIGLGCATGGLDGGVHLYQYQARMVQKCAARAGQFHAACAPAE